MTLKHFTGRYRKSFVGPLWLMVSTVLQATGLAILYSQILNSDIHTYFPYVTLGIINWSLVSSIFNSGANVFNSGAGIFNQMPISKSIFVFRALGSCLMAYSFKIPVIIAVMAFVAHVPSVMSVVIALAGVLLTVWTGFWFMLIYGVLGLRFKDLGHATTAFMSAIFFFTPIFWYPERLKSFSWIVEYNPFHHFLNIIRGPLLGHEGVANSFIWAGSASVVMMVLGFLVFGLFARRLSYWT